MLLGVLAVNVTAVECPISCYIIIIIIIITIIITNTIIIKNCLSHYYSLQRFLLTLKFLELDNCKFQGLEKSLWFR